MMYDEVEEWLADARRAIESVDAAALTRAGHALAQVRYRGGTIFIAGNGGSASTANHFACDLQKATRIDGRGTRAVSLSDNSALLTAWGNDLRSTACSRNSCAYWGLPETHSFYSPSVARHRIFSKRLPWRRK